MGTGAGAGQDGGTSEAGTGTGAAGGQGNAGAPAANAGGSGTAPLDRSKLPSILQNMDESQISEVFDTMVDAVRNRRDLEGRDLSGVPAHARPEPKKEPSQQELAAVYKKMFDPSDDEYNPGAAVADILQRSVGPLLGNINSRAIVGMMTSFRNNADYPDFADVEKDVTAVLSRRPDPAGITEADIATTYLAVMGAREVDKKRKAAKAPPPSTRQPSAEDQGPPKKKAFDQLDDVERTVAKAMYPHATDPYQSYLDDVQLEQKPMKVPVGGGKKE